MISLCYEDGCDLFCRKHVTIKVNNIFVYVYVSFVYTMNTGW